MIADLPTWVDVQLLREVSGTVVVAALLLAVVLMFILRSLTTKLVILVVIAGVMFGLVHYRETLESCGKDGCGCVLFGEPVHNDNCPDT